MVANTKFLSPPPHGADTLVQPLRPLMEYRGIVSPSSSQQRTMHIEMTPENIQTMRAFPALLMPIATLPGCTKIPVAIVRLNMRHAVVKVDNSPPVDGENVKRCMS